MAQGKTRKQKKIPGKEQGLSFWHCFFRGKLYSRDLRGPAPFLYLIPLLAGWLLLDIVLRCHYSHVGMVGFDYIPAWLFTIGWSVLMVGLVLALPKGFKWFFRCVPLMFCMACMETHSGFFNYFGNCFSLSILSFVGGGDFADSSYIKIDGEILAGAITTIVLMMLSGHLLKVMPQKTTRGSVGAGLIVALMGLGLIVGTANSYFPPVQTVIWKVQEEDLPTVTYQEFTDKTNCLMLSGLYQYTARDIWALVKPDSTLSAGEREQIEEYITEYEAAQQPNDYTGLLAGKNVILVQLEAIDTWMLDKDYMPNLYRLKTEGISFENHYTPAFIAASTFNTEFLVNTSLLPATGSTPTTVYTQNHFPYALAALFEKAGYTANSFHGNVGTVYDRENVHPNLGYERYTDGEGMGMYRTHLDRYLTSGFDQMTVGEPFFSFVITISAHGTYSPESDIYLNHAEKANAAAERTDGNYVYAVAGAMETDLFIGGLLDCLAESGHWEDTVLVFYADHYNTYMLDKNLVMELKGVDNENLMRRTDFFLWSADLTPTVVEKVTSSADVLPTLANLFGLDTHGAFLVGHDGLGEQGGYAFFSDGSWYDGETYWDSATPVTDPARTAEITRAIKLSGLVLGGNYYGEDS